ncbi:MAG TPA: cytochrome c biogenesis protein/redoxin [Pyrinomonadaceae bacterium]|nr:cytochrome c biogenesis protein/redoxin [Pyrinomonadaceae bacterium]HXM49058.1 cytochrome c biogenesis protein/redoxin [Pyrinomonadaceae bacterium]
MQISFLNMLIAFAGGLLSFLSPCVLPLVPGYLSLMSGVSIDHMKGEGGSRSGALRAVVINSIAFNIGLSVIFIALGATAGLVGSSVLSNPWIRIVGGIVIIVFGLHLIGLLKIKYLYKDTRQFSNEKPRGVLGSLTLGIAFAAGWTPCIGPILGGIMALAATSGGWKGGFVLATFYSAGLAVPFLITGLGINKFLGFYSKFRKHLHKVEVVSGVVLISIGLLIATGYSSLLASSRVAGWLPNFETWLRPVTPAAPLPGNSTFAPAPDVEFEALDGKPIRLSSLHGRVVLLNFWATWCLPCRAEIPEFNALQRDLESKGLSVVGVSVSPVDTSDSIRSFQKDIKQDYTVLRGPETIGSQFGNGPGLPVTYLLDREGRIRQKFNGPQTRESFEAAIKPVLDEAPATAQKNN